MPVRPGINFIETGEVVETCDAGAPELPQACGVPIKWLSLAALTLMTTLHAFVIKYARAGGTNYSNSTCVFFTELLKTIASAVLLTLEARGARSASKVACTSCFQNHADTLRMCIPAMAYVIQNNLIFFSLDKLSMSIQQVTYQLKILAAGVIGVVMMGKHLSPTKWGALFLLIVGIAVVQSSGTQSIGTRDSTDSKLVFLEHNEPDGVSSFSGQFLGFVAVFVACLLSGFSGAYMEMMLKQSGSSLWLRNVQLGCIGTVFAFLSAIVDRPDILVRWDWMRGYSWRVWLAIAVLGLGGLLVAVVLKYADNILRQFSTALSLLLTTALSSLVLGERRPDARFFIGATIAMAATCIYNVGLPRCTYYWSYGGATSRAVLQDH